MHTLEVAHAIARHLLSFELALHLKFGYRAAEQDRLGHKADYDPLPQKV